MEMGVFPCLTFIAPVRLPVRAVCVHEQIIEQRKDESIAPGNRRKAFKTDHDTIVPWLNFFLPLLKQAVKALSYLEEEKVEDLLSPRQHEVWKYLSSVGEAAPREIVTATGIALGTVRQALDRLVEVGKVKRIGRGRGTRYVKLPN